MSTRDAFEKRFGRRPTIPANDQDEDYWIGQQTIWDAELNSWEACQVHNDTVIAELVEALERLDGWLEVRNLGGLMPAEKALIAKHKVPLE